MESNNTIDIISPLKRLEETGHTLSHTPFRDGYLFGIRHALELASIFQKRIDMRLAVTEQLIK